MDSSPHFRSKIISSAFARKWLPLRSSQYLRFLFNKCVVLSFQTIAVKVRNEQAPVPAHGPAMNRRTLTKVGSRKPLVTRSAPYCSCGGRPENKSWIPVPCDQCNSCEHSCCTTAFLISSESTMWIAAKITSYVRIAHGFPRSASPILACNRTA